jgi:NADPH:quinone reductase-like Zn-dependent oxidoreductase
VQKFWDTLVSMIKDGVLKAECDEYPFTEWRKAITAATGERRQGKTLLMMPDT